MRQILFLVLCLGFVAPAFSADVILPTGVSRDRLATEVLWHGFKKIDNGKRPRVIVVLGGGGARGLSHVGVLRILEQEKIPVDQIVGVSVGALIGALYAGGKSVDQIEGMASEVGWDHLTDYSKAGVLKLLLTEELLSTKRMETYLSEQIGDVFFNDLNIPFTCIATDLRTGDRIVFREGPVAIAARASATVPGFFRPVFYRQRYLVDGGLVDNLPTGVISDAEGNFVLAVEPRGQLERSEMKNVLHSLVRAIEIQRELIVDQKNERVSYLIRPNVEDISVLDVGRYQESINAGLEEASRSSLELKQSIIHFVLDQISWDTKN